MHNFITLLATVDPDPLFLLMASGFLGVIMAFLIPVSIDITSKVAAKYNSDVVVRLFQSNTISKYFPFFVLINIGAMLTLRFFTQSPFFTYEIKLMMWILLLFTIIITILIGYLVYRLERIISDDNVPLDMLIKRIEKDFKHRYISIKKESIIEAVEGIGDILLYQTNRKNNRPILYGLTELSKMATKLIRLKLFQLEKYEILVYSRELINYQKDNNIEATSTFCFKNQDRNLGCLVAYINQIERICLTAMQDNNREVTEYALRVMYSALQTASTQANNELAVELLVKKINNCVNSSIQEREFSDESIISWYIDNMLKEPHRGNGSFHIPYLDIYDPYFVNTLQGIINSNKYSSFRAVINYMSDNFHFSDYQREKLWGYHYLLRAADFEKYLEINREERVQRRVRNLIEEENQMYTIAQLNDWLESFEQLRKIINKNLMDENSKRKARQLEGEIIDNAIKHLKYTRLIRLSYAIGTLCMINENYEYIRYMRETVAEVAKREIGLNMVPQTLQEVMNDYLIFYDLSNRHKLAINSYRRYVLMLIENLLNKEASKEFYLPFLRQEQVGPGLEALEGLISVATADANKALKEAQETKQGGKRVNTNTVAAKLPQTLVLKFLHPVHKETAGLLVKARSNMSISTKVKDSFRISFMDGFNQRLVVRCIFDKYLKIYKNDAKGKYQELPNRPWGINELADKTSFLGSEDTIKRGAYQYGVTLADIENMTLFDNMMKYCRKQNPHSFESFLRRIGKPEDLLILSSYSVVNRFLKQQERFHMAKHMGHTVNISINAAKKTKQEDLSKINGFVGYYDINEYPVPVFNFYYRGGGDYLLILHKSLLGQLVQMPLVSHPPENKKYLKLTSNSIYFNLEELAKNSPMQNEYIADAPTWLTEVGDVKQQREFLKQKVLITVLENLSFSPTTTSKLKPAKSPTKNFPVIGYIINTGKTRNISNVNEIIS